jgi:hypothetical protein
MSCTINALQSGPCSCPRCSAKRWKPHLHERIDLLQLLQLLLQALFRNVALTAEDLEHGQGGVARREDTVRFHLGSYDSLNVCEPRPRQ